MSADLTGVAGDYLRALERELQSAHPDVRTAELAAFREEVSWLDSRGIAQLLDALGPADVRAREILAAHRCTAAPKAVLGRLSGVVFIAAKTAFSWVTSHVSGWNGGTARDESDK